MFHIGVDLGGTKLLAAAISPEGESLARYEVATPRHDYEATLATIAELVLTLEVELGGPAPTGVGMPGSLNPETGLVQNANSTWLNQRPFASDLQRILNREIRFANDANCFALSECWGGAGAAARSLFGVIMGTGVGGGFIINGQLHHGPRAIGGEWGHCSLPFPTLDELKLAPGCWCGAAGCIESWISGPALTQQYNHIAAKSVYGVEDIVERAGQGCAIAQQALDHHAERTARALSMVVNVLDPELIVLGGGLSSLDYLYDTLPQLMRPFIFSDSETQVDIRPPVFGAASGVRGAAALWPFQGGA